MSGTICIISCYFYLNKNKKELISDTGALTCCTHYHSYAFTGWQSQIWMFMAGCYWI